MNSRGTTGSPNSYCLEASFVAVWHDRVPKRVEAAFMTHRADSALVGETKQKPGAAQVKFSFMLKDMADMDAIAKTCRLG